jgi:ABC-2 type transport system permease protein
MQHLRYKTNYFFTFVCITLNMKDTKYYRQRMFTYYEMVRAVALRNIKVRYKNSALGFLWSMLNPLVFLVIFVFIFSNAFLTIENYPLYAITGLIFWSFFSTSSNQIISSILESGPILKSFSIPPIVFPISALVASLMNLAISFVPFVGLMFFFGFQLKWVTLMIIPVIILFALFTFGFSLILCTFNAFFRDVSMFWGTVSPALLYFTPVAYASSLVPENYRWLLEVNPLFHYFEIIRDVLYYGRFPSLYYLSTSTAFAVISVVVSVFIFNKLKRGFISCV